MPRLAVVPDLNEGEDGAPRVVPRAEVGVGWQFVLGVQRSACVARPRPRALANHNPNHAMHPTLVQQVRLRAACLRHRGPYQQIGETFARLDTLAEAGGLFEDPPQLVAVYHDNPATVPAAELRSDAGVLVADGKPIPDGLTEVFLSAGSYVWARHVGPYRTLPETWARLREYVTSGDGPRRGDGPGYEVYRNTPATAAPEELLTDVFIPTA